MSSDNFVLFNSLLRIGFTFQALVWLNSLHSAQKQVKSHLDKENDDLLAILSEWHSHQRSDLKLDEKLSIKQMWMRLNFAFNPITHLHPEMFDWYSPISPTIRTVWKPSTRTWGVPLHSSGFQIKVELGYWSSRIWLQQSCSVQNYHKNESSANSVGPANASFIKLLNKFWISFRKIK